MLADMGALPTTLMAGLVMPTASRRHDRPDGHHHRPRCWLLAGQRRRPSPSPAPRPTPAVASSRTSRSPSTVGTTWHRATGTTSWTLHRRHRRPAGPPRSRSAPATTAPTSARRCPSASPSPARAPSSARRVPDVTATSDGSDRRARREVRPRRRTASSPASASTRAPATAGPTPARCGAPPAARLATRHVLGESASGWQTLTFAAPVAGHRGDHVRGVLLRTPGPLRGRPPASSAPPTGSRRR